MHKYMIRKPTEDEIATLLPKVSKGWSNFEHEHETENGFFFSAEQIEGEIPRDLNASFVRNGPGLTVVHGTPLAHPIDGDGLVAKLTFKNGKCFFQCKFVQSKMHQEETKAKQILYNGSMGTRIPKTVGGVKPKPGFRDPGHTNVFYAGTKLFAAYEYTLPHTMDPTTLDTFGPTSMDNELELKAMSAHFKVDYSKNRLVTVAFKAGNPMAPDSKISFYEWSNDSEMRLESCARLTLDSVNYAHDFVLTPNWYVVHVTPFVDTTKETFKRIVKGELAPGETMRYCPELPSQFVLIERQPKSQERRVIRMETEPCHIFHYANCRETADGMIVFEACCLPPGFTMQWQHKAFLSNSADAPGVMHTYLCDVNKQTLQRSMLPGLETTSCEFPTVHPYRNCVPLNKPQVSTRYFYLMGSRPGQALPFSDVIKYDTLTKTQKRWRCELGVVGEPCFMPRLGERSALEGDEDDGYVICQVYLYEEQRNQFVVLDAKNLNLVCKLSLPFHLPYGFHGTYTEKIALPPSHSKL